MSTLDKRQATRKQNEEIILKVFYANPLATAPQLAELSGFSSVYVRQILKESGNQIARVQRGRPKGSKSNRPGNFIFSYKGKQNNEEPKNGLGNDINIPLSAFPVLIRIKRFKKLILINTPNDLPEKDFYILQLNVQPEVHHVNIDHTNKRVISPNWR